MLRKDEGANFVTYYNRRGVLNQERRSFVKCPNQILHPIKLSSNIAMPLHCYSNTLHRITGKMYAYKNFQHKTALALELHNSAWNELSQFSCLEIFVLLSYSIASGIPVALTIVKC